MRKLAKLRLVNPKQGFRTVADKAPQAELMAEQWAEHIAPYWQKIYSLRRRIATVGTGVLACLLLLHVVFGANGMVVYQQKHNEVRDLRIKAERIRQENEALAAENAELGSDNSKAIEREAREHLHYAKPGEVVYVPPQPQATAPPEVHSAKK